MAEASTRCVSGWMKTAGGLISDIEVKLTDNPGYRHATGLRKFSQEYPQAAGGILLHGGMSIRRLDENIITVPWTELTG